jgi:AMP-polyphosphate phosphotransferase
VTKPLDKVDLTLSLSGEESLKRITTAQRRLTQLTLYTAGLLEMPTPGPGVVALLEGFDAAGKGGAIRRITEALDPRHVRVVPIGPPTPLELSHHFLWRFQDPLPAHGALTIFDRSWYGRVLVERVEHLIAPDVVQRSMTEIVEFERALVRDHTIVVKFWLHISADEQLRRFNERAEDPLKKWKLTPDDWRNRERRDAYVDAVNDMIEHTDHPHAHWHVVPAENKHYARVFVLDALNAALEKGLESKSCVVPDARDEDYLDRS